MARVTTQDCSDVIKDRFELVLIAARRARDLMMGSHPLIDAPNDKNEVIALREIAGNLLNINSLRKRLVCEIQGITYTDNGVDEEILDVHTQYEASPVDLKNNNSQIKKTLASEDL